jgi:hypothetical protein
MRRYVKRERASDPNQQRCAPTAPELSGVVAQTAPAPFVAALLASAFQ